MTEHADLEALSAYVDGEAPEWADHVGRCASCRASVDELRAVAAAVAAPVEPPSRAQREIAVAAALTDVVDRYAAVQATAARRRSEARWLLPAIAAVVLVVAGFSAMLTFGNHAVTQRDTTTASPALESGPGAGALSAPTADAVAPGTPTIDLGDVADAASLAAKARPGLAAAKASGGTGGTSAAAAASSASTTVAPFRAGVPAPAIVGTRPCEAAARARQPSLGPVVYFATARRQGVPAVVLGFSTSADPASPVNLLLLAQDGCAELLRVAGP